ncbi:MAG TPA: MerR family transcriptional regulator [Chitinophagaceae bacterium]|nr:MerR family transcriptional regulator [Chitinophagaceae bacterium]
MHVFTIRDIENLTAIKAHTLRIWEQRYGLLKPARKTGNHRLYSNDDLKQMLKIATLYRNGYKISKIAALTPEQVSRQALDTYIIQDPFQLYAHHLTEAAIDLDGPKFEKIIDGCILQYGFEKTLFQILYPFLHKVGLLWVTGNVVPAMEHFASCIIMRKLCVALNGVEVNSQENNAVVLLFTPEHERHEIPILAMQYLLKKNGIKAVSLGQHVTVKILADYCTTHAVTHLYTHIITYLRRYDIDKYIAELSAKFYNKQIVVSGAMVQDLQRSFLNVRILKTDEEMIAFSRKL